MTARITRLLAGLTVLLVTLTGCSMLNAENIPVSSGVKDGYEVTIFFPDALNLAVGAAVKIDGARIGRVEEVTTEKFQAKVRLAVNGDTPLPQDSTFRLRPTTALGELFVEVIRGEAKKPLKSGVVIDAASTRAAPTVEDGLAAASLLINGGSLSQIKTIVSEINTALEGRTGTVKEFIRGADKLVGSLNDGRTDLDGLLTALAETSTLLNKREKEINAAIDLAGPAAQVLRRNSGKVTDLLTEVAGMSGNVDKLVKALRGDLVTTLAQLGPVVSTLTANKAQAKQMLQKVSQLAPLLDRGVPTDYLNLLLILRFNANTLFGRSEAEGAR
ncbi:MCE family protein [Nocardioides sp. Bht2]|uniref:MCE family protein n=1 Tax=Nocardioides sp. Bht2 TaxID=3392297 RepID=UPI0039B4C0C1